MMTNTLIIFMSLVGITTSLLARANVRTDKVAGCKAPKLGELPEFKEIAAKLGSNPNYATIKDVINVATKAVKDIQQNHLPLVPREILLKFGAYVRDFSACAQSNNLRAIKECLSTFVANHPLLKSELLPIAQDLDVGVDISTISKEIRYKTARLSAAFHPFAFLRILALKAAKNRNLNSDVAILKKNSIGFTKLYTKTSPPCNYHSCQKTRKIKEGWFITRYTSDDYTCICNFGFETCEMDIRSRADGKHVWVETEINTSNLPSYMKGHSMYGVYVTYMKQNHLWKTYLSDEAANFAKINKAFDEYVR